MENSVVTQTPENNQPMYSAVEQIKITQDEVLYDAQAVQRIHFDIAEDEDIEPVVLVVNPISDDRFADYDAACSTKLVDDGKNLTTSVAKPSGKLWDELVTAVENVEIEGGQENWKEAFDLLQFKIPSLNQYLAVSVYEQPRSNNGKFVASVSADRTVLADLTYNDDIVTTRHYLKKMNFEYAKELENTQKLPIQNRSKGMRETSDFTFPSSVKGKAALYDKMQSRPADGFVNGIAPIRVKAKVIDFIAKAQVQQKK